MSGPAYAASDEEQVRTVLERMNAAYNGTDFSAFASHLCPTMTPDRRFRAGWYQSRKTDGPTQITVNSVGVKGGPPYLAVANVRFDAADHEPRPSTSSSCATARTGRPAGTSPDIGLGPPGVR